jgi:hypothetical protein
MLNNCKLLHSAAECNKSPITIRALVLPIAVYTFAFFRVVGKATAREGPRVWAARYLVATLLWYPGYLSLVQTPPT